MDREAEDEAIKAIARKPIVWAPLSARILPKRPSAWAATFISLAASLPQAWPWVKLATVIAALFIIFWQMRVRR